jgi:coenzyme Q-binding protein COQ10
MALAVVDAERRLPYAPDDLCALVADVRSYPRFIPWLQKLDIVSERREGETWIALARAEVGWRAIAEHFTTEVRVQPRRVDVALVDGPFRRLENRWRFASAPGGGALVQFHVAYEFRNPLLQAIATLNRDIAAQRIMAAFEGEAKRRLARAPGA